MNGKLQASIKDVVNLLGTNLYSEESVVIRELIQNAYDSIVTRYGDEASKKGRIIFRIKSNTSIEVVDNGTGMDEEDLIIYLSTMGKTLKKMSKDAKLIGKYGIGFFSSFMIAETVVVTTKKNGGKLCNWSSDGIENFSIIPIDDKDAPVGTIVTLNLQLSSHKFSQPAYLKNCIIQHCNYLDCPIFFDEEQVNSQQFPWEKEVKEKVKESLQKHYGEEIRFFKYFKNKEHKYECILCLVHSGPYFELFSKRLFVSDNLTNVVPDELKFIKIIINCDSIELTLARESQKKGLGWTFIVNSVREIAVSWLNELATKFSEDPFIIDIIRQNQLQFQKSALREISLFNSIYNLIGFDLSNFEEKQVTIVRYRKLFKNYNDKIYFNDGKSSEKFASLLRVLKEKNIPVFVVQDHSEKELLRKIANKVSAHLMNIEISEDIILEDFDETKSNKLLGFCESVTNRNVKFKSIDPDWIPMITTPDSIYLNSKNSFINELDNLRISSVNSRVIIQNFFRTFESIAQIRNSNDHIFSLMVKNVIHAFKNWLSDLEKSENLAKEQEYMHRWWSEQASIRDLNSKRTFIQNGTSFFFRCFIICPFKDKYLDVINQVKNTFVVKGIFAETAENIDNIGILKKVCAAIDHCDFAVVDISENNPNVMLELGLLIARRKPAIIIRNINVEKDQGIKVPVDIISIERVEYSNTSEDLHAKLSKISDIIIPKKNA